MARSIIINSTDATTGKKSARAITNVNPKATNAQIKTLAQGLNGLTKNTYNSATLIEKTDLDVAKNNPAFTPQTATYSWEALKAGAECQISTQPAEYINEGGKIYIKSCTAAVLANVTGFYTINGFSPYVNILSNDFCETFYEGATAEEPSYDAASGNELTRGHTGTIVVARTETDSYAPAEFTITITA